MVERLLAPFLPFMITLVVSIGCSTNMNGKVLDFRPVDSEYNERLQVWCKNPEFAARNPEHVGFSTEGSYDDNDGEEKDMHYRRFRRHAAELGKHPWAAAFRVFSKVQCAGTIISKRHILTSATCLKKVANWTSVFSVAVLVEGLCAGRSQRCKEIDMHEVSTKMGAYTEGYKVQDDSVLLDFGLGIVQMSEDLNEEWAPAEANHWLPACLVRIPVQEPPMEATIFGWGRTKVRFLQNEEYMRPRVMCRKRSFNCWDIVMNSLATAHMGKIGGGVISFDDIGQGRLLPHLVGVVAGSSAKSNVVVVASVLSEEWNYAICYYTGVCTRAEWTRRRAKMENFEPPDNPQHQFNARYDLTEWIHQLEKSTTVVATLSLETTTTTTTPIPAATTMHTEETEEPTLPSEPTEALPIPTSTPTPPAPSEAPYIQPYPQPPEPMEAPASPPPLQIPTDDPRALLMRIPQLAGEFLRFSINLLIALVGILVSTVNSVIGLFSSRMDEMLG